ncbi:MAG: metal ABC transporter permease [Deltaproteobacteria bacterium]|nr:MAG: metal ABC transporter permease [Deltaproteobacteria bacterium]
MREAIDSILSSPDVFGPPIAAAALAGLVLGWLGVWIVLRRMVFVSAAIAQSSALGVALIFLLHGLIGWELEPLVGGAVATAAAGLLFVFEPSRLKVTRESILGFVYVAAGAATLVVGDAIPQESQEISAVLFGNAVLIRDADLAAIAIAGGLVLAVQLWLHRGFVLAAFDPETARVQGVPTGLLDALLFLSIGITIAASIRALGALPVFAFSVLPAMGALAHSRRMLPALVAAGVLGLLSGVMGYLIAFAYELTVGATQTLTACALGLVALVLAGVRR